MSDPMIYFLLFLVAGLFITLFLWPDKGVFSSWLYRLRTKQKVLLEDALKFIQHCEFHNEHATLHGLAGAMKISTSKASKVLDQMSVLNLIQVAENEIHLTPKGFDYALRITRAHRLLEEFLAQETSLPLEEFHKRADKLEHTLTENELEELSLQLGNPSFDPHGDPIPTASGKIIKMEGKPLTDHTVNRTFRITHLEDEPVEVYSQLVAEGLYPGMVIYLTEKSPKKYRFWSKLGEHILTPMIATNISVVPVDNVRIPQKGISSRLSDLALGAKAEIVSLSPYLRNVERRRLMDLGIIPGTFVEAQLRSARGDPTAYRVRGSLIALRQDQTNLIEIKPLGVEEKDLINV